MIRKGLVLVLIIIIISTLFFGNLPNIRAECPNKNSDLNGIETKEIATKSGRTILVQLTKRGGNALGKLGYETKNGMRQYGLVHEFWRDKVKRYYEKLGYKVALEKKLNGERADLVAEKSKEKIAIESAHKSGLVLRLQYL